MGNLTRKTFYRRPVCLLLALSVTTFAHGQAAQRADIFIPIPETLRARFLERLSLSLEYQRTQQWEKLYELLPKDLRLAGPREEFVNRPRRRKTRVLVEYIPRGVLYFEPDDAWVIFGCSAWDKGGKASATVTAYFRDGEWYLTPVSLSVSKDGKVEPCRRKGV